MMPFVSFCIKSYNHSCYVRQALAGAFSQTYRPMEIVIVDDNSTDGSADIIREEISNYQKHGGDIPIAFVVNPRNLGNTGNWLRVCELAKGELLIKADGDDVSLPERTEKVVSAWLKTGKRAIVVSHRGWNMTPDGHRFGVFRPISRVEPLGTAMAWRPECLTAFDNDIDGFKFYDDDVFARRARMLDGYKTADGLVLSGEVVMDEPLIEYRVGTGASTSMFDFKKAMRSCHEHILIGLEQARKDLVTARKWLDETKENLLAESFSREERVSRDWLDLHFSTRFRKRIEAYGRLKAGPILSPYRLQQIACLLPPCLSAAVLNLYLRLNYVRRRWLSR